MASSVFGYQLCMCVSVCLDVCVFNEIVSRSYVPFKSGYIVI